MGKKENGVAEFHFVSSSFAASFRRLLCRFFVRIVLAFLNDFLLSNSS